MAYIKDVQVGSDTYLIEPTLYIAPTKNGAAYTATLANFSLATGATVQAKFAATNNENATLNISSTGAKEIHYNGDKITANQFKVNHVYTLVYDGTQWQVVGDIDTNTNTWRGIQDNLTSDSTTESLSAKQGKVLKGLIDAMDATTPAASGNATAFIDSITQTDGKITSITKKNIPTVSSSTAGLAPKGTAVSTQSTSTKFLREDGTWAAPSYITNTDAKVAQSSNTEDKEFPIILKNTDNTTNETNGVKYDGDVTVNPSKSKITATTIQANSRLVASKAISQIITGTGTAGSYTNSTYHPAKWTFNTGLTATDGDIFTIKIPVAGHDYGVFMSVDNGSHYYPVVLNGTGRITTHYPVNTYLTVIFEPTGSAASMYAVAGQTSSTRITVTGGVWRVLNYYDSNSNDTGYYHRRIYPNLKAGTGSVDKYTIIMQLPNGRWSSIVQAPSWTTNSSGSVIPKDTGKSASANGFMLGHVLLMYANATYADGANIGTYNIWSAHTGLIDARYSFNLANSTGNGFVAYTPVYIVGTVSDGLFHLDTTKWWTQTLPSSDDGKVYIYIGDAYDWYRITFTEDKPMYWYKDGAIRLYSGASEYALSAPLSGISDADDLKAIEAISDTSGLLKKTAANTWTLDTNNYVTSSGVTKVSTGAGLTGGDITTTGTVKANLTNETKLTNAAADGTETSGRIYPVRLDKNGKLAVNVPWTNVNSSYLPLTGGTMTGAINLVGNQDSAYNDKGLIFTKGSRIGENTTGGLGIYAAERIYLRPNSPTSNSGVGIEISGDGVIPSNNNTESFGDSSHKWANVYATNLNGNLSVTAHTNTTNGSKNYYPWFSTATSGNLGARAHAGIYIHETVTSGAISSLDFCMGSSTITGSITLWDGTNHWGNIRPTNLSDNRSYTLPNQAGTFALLTQTDANALINLLSTGASDLTANDYVITQYVGGGTTNITYYRRPASKVVNATLVKAALGTVSTTAKKFLKDTGTWAQVAWGDLTGVPSSFAPSSHDHNRLNSIGRLTSATAIAYNPSASQGFKLVWNIYDSVSRTNDATNSPSFDAGVINIPWDWGGYNGQIAISNTTKDNTRMQIRSANHIDNGEGANPRYTPNYGAWREVVTATKATKVGDTNKPVYINATGQATAISYTIAKSVPSDAIFTDHYDWSDITNKPTTLSGYGITNAVQYNGIDNDIGSGATAANAKSYWANNSKVPKGKIVFNYNSSGYEFTTLFSNNNNSYGSILRWGYQDTYIRILRAHPNQTTYNGWYTEDWEKISAGYADTAPWSGISSKPTTISGYGITDAKINSGVITLGSNTITPVTSVNGHTGTSVNVTAGDLGLSSALRYQGTTTTVMSDGLTTAKVTINNADFTPSAGDVVIYNDAEYLWTGSLWELIGAESSFKKVQTAVNSSSASGSSATTFVSSVTQDTQGVITVKTSTLNTGGTWSGNATTATTATNLANNPSIQASTSNTNQVTITAGGKTSSAYTVPYATSAGSATSATTSTYIKCTDTRSTALNPTDLNAAQGVRFDFKAKGTINLTATDAYAGVMSFRPYASNSDWSGGNAHQLAFNSQGLHWRNGGASWGDWYQILDSSNTASGTNNAATLAWNTTYTIAKINGTDIKFTTMAKPTYSASDVGALASTTKYAASSSVGGAATNATTTANTSDSIYPVGVKSGATTTLLHDTSITMKGNTITAVTYNSTAASLTSETSTTANTAKYATLTLGNNANVNTTTAHSEGQIVIYSAATQAHTIKGTSTTTAYTHTLPNDTGLLVSLSDGTAKGSTTKPVYIPNTGIVTECSTYAGGTKVTFNGADKGASTASFYAPTAGGTAGHILIGAGATTAPAWYGGTVMSGTAAASWKTAFSGTTDATATNAAAVTIAGGLGVAKKLHVGDTATVPDLTIGSTNEYGDAYTPIYWHDGVPTAVTPIQYCEFTIGSGKKGVKLTHAAFTAASYVTQVVVTSGESNLNSTIAWESAAGYINLTCSATSGAVSGYILVSRGGAITATATDIT